MGDPKLAKSFARDIGLMKEVGIFPVIIHGGGPQIAEKLKTKNITSKFVDGLRVTDAKTVKVVEDVLVNEINTEIVKAISDSGGKAIGLSGNENNLLSATKLKAKFKISLFVYNDTEMLIFTKIFTEKNLSFFLKTTFVIGFWKEKQTRDCK